jgi:hypothetical protein
VYANVITWRLAPGEDLHRFVRDVTAQVGDWPPPGMIDGYVVRAGPERVITIGLYESAEYADAVAAKLREGVGALGHRAQFVERQAGETHDIWGPDPMWES